MAAPVTTRRLCLAAAVASLWLAAVAVPTAAAATTLTVSTTADIAANAGACGNSSTTVPSPLSLREATCLANNIGGTVNIVVPAGHYNLANGELQPGQHSGQTVNITGAGAASTIIDGQGLSRVLDYDKNIVGGVNASISGVTITGGADHDFGGAGIIAGSAHATTSDVTTIDSVIFSGNQANTGAQTATNRPGGAVSYNGGKLSVTGSTFSNNGAYSSPGSALSYTSQGDASPEGLSIDNTTFDSNHGTSAVANLSLGGAVEIGGVAGQEQITNTRFTNNTVTGTNGSAVGAGIFVQNGTLSVTGSTFSGNSVTSSGASASGAAVYNSLGTTTLNYNRFAGNNSPSSSAVAVQSGTVDATKNWWGCNGGPNTIGCDGVSGTATTTPYLVLSGSASPSTVNGPNGTSTISAGFTRDSAGVAVDTTKLGAFSGQSITWSDPTPSPATVSSAGTAISSGTAQVTYNSQSAAGAGHVVGSFDNGSVTVPLTVNRAPAISSADHETFTVGVSHSFTVASNGSPTPALSKTGTLPSGLTFVDQGDGTALLQGTPAAGSAGSYPLTITATNSAGNAQQSFTLTVQPGAVDDSASVTEDSGANTIDVLANDNSPSGPKTVTAKSDGSNGTVAITHSGADLTYTPSANYCGSDTFTYTLNGTSTATVSVDVTCVDDPTTAVDDSATLTEDSGATTIDVRQNDTDIDSAKELITAVGTGAATHGSVAITNSGADLTYTPAADYCNAGAPNDADPDATFTYTLSGGSTATVSVAVTCVNDPPRIAGGGTLGYTEGDGAKQISSALTVADPEGDSITGATISISAGYAAGQDSLTWTDDLGDNITRDVSSNDQTLVLTGAGTAAQYQAALRQVAYTNSSDTPDTTARTVTFSATDTGAATGSGTATVNVAAANDPPAAVDDSYATDEDTALTKTAAQGVLGNDTDADHDPLTATLVSGPAHAASFTLNPDGSFSYTPAADYHGSDSFTYKANDGSADSPSAATVSLTVNSVDDPPVAVDDAATVSEDASASSIDVTQNDTDVDGGSKLVSSVTQPAHGTVAIAGSGQDLTYTPDANYCGTDSLTYTLNGGSTATVSVTVDCVDDPPIAMDDQKTVTQGSGASVVDVIGNDRDVDGGPEQIVSLTHPGHGAAALTSGGSALTYVPDRGYCTAPGAAPDTFTYTLNGGSEATVAVTVTCTLAKPPPGLSIGHPGTALKRGRVELRLLCRGGRGQRCAGLVRLVATGLKSRLSSAAATPQRFDITAGHSELIRIKPPKRLLSILRTRGKAIGKVIASMPASGHSAQPVTRLITVTPERKRR